MYTISMVGRVCLLGVVNTLAFTPLQNIITTRAFVSALQRRLSYELLDANQLIVALEEFHHTHAIQPILFGSVVSLVSVLVFSGNREKNTRLTTWRDFVLIEKQFDRFLLIFLIIMSKNIENAI
jgi:hypothetical protein